MGSSVQTTVDKFGRIVIPKALRDGLGLDPGAIVDIEERDDGIVLKPVREEPDLIMKEGILVFMGKAGGDLSKAVSKMREDRLQRASGWKDR